MQKVAYELRNGEPAWKTNIRWGASDLVLERKLKSKPRDSFRHVTVLDLPPVNLNPPPQLPRPTSSPAPERKQRRKRGRSNSLDRVSPQSKVSKSVDSQRLDDHWGEGKKSSSGLANKDRSKEPSTSPAGLELRSKFKPDFQ